MRLVALIARDHDQHAGLASLTHGIEHRCRADHVRRKSFERVAMRKPHERLGREVHDDIGLRGFHGRSEPRRVADVVLVMALDEIAHRCRLEERGIRGRLERIARDVGPGAMQEHHEPRALEARVARDEHPLPA